jgi:hypothetical protein
MPNRWAVANGNWSNTATWNNGAILGLPTASDDVYANQFNVILNQDISVNLLASAQLTGTASNGGTFITSGSRTIQTFASGTLGGFVVQIGAASPATSSCALVVTGSDTVNINAVRIASAANAAGGTVPTGSINIKSSGITNISTSNSIQGITGPAIRINSGSGGTCNIQSPVIFGDTFGGGGAARMAILIDSVNGYILNVTGSLQAGTNSNSGAISNPVTIGATNIIINISGSVISDSSINVISLTGGSTTLNITGPVLTRNASVAAAIVVTGGTFANININGDVTSGLVSAIISTQPGTSSIAGSIIASSDSPGVQFTSATHFLSATGPFYNVNNRNAVFAPNLQLISGSTPTWTFDTETVGTQRTLYTDRDPQTYPSASNVRSGITYGATNEITGVVIIPPTSSVTQGVLVDNTTGSASFTIQNAWTTPTSSLTGSTAIGTRLKNTATVANVAAAISSKGTI